MEDSTRHAGVDLERYGDAWEAWRTIVHALLHLDPFMDVEEIDRFEPLQDEIDLDAVRWRSFITEVASGCGLDIPEVDEPEVLTLDGLEQYLTRAGRGGVLSHATVRPAAVSDLDPAVHDGITPRARVRQAMGQQQQQQQQQEEVSRAHSRSGGAP